MLQYNSLMIAYFVIKTVVKVHNFVDWSTKPLHAQRYTLEDNAGFAFCIQLKHVGIVYTSDPWRDADVWPVAKLALF